MGTSSGRVVRKALSEEANLMLRPAVFATNYTTKNEENIPDTGNINCEVPDVIKSSVCMKARKKDRCEK